MQTALSQSPPNSSMPGINAQSLREYSMDTSPGKSLVLEAEVIDALQTCFDPEIPVNIYELGLIYDVQVDGSGLVKITMTLTSPSCPAAQSLPSEVESKVKSVEGVAGVEVNLVWEPPWDPNKMSEAAKLQLGMF
jgi:FeS assembly SUF system protein